MTFSELMSDFGTRLGIPLEPDADGVYGFDVEGMTFAIHDLPENAQAVFTGDLGQPPPENPEGLYRLVLEAQYLFQETQGSTLSLNPETGRFTLCRTLPLLALDPDTFFAAAEQFINTLEAWSKIIRNYRAAADAAPASGTRTQPDLLTSFIRA